MTTRRLALRLHLTSLTLGIALLGAGCSLLSGPPPHPTRFFLLTTVSHAGDIPTGRRLALGLGPVTLPAYLNRPEMVTRVAPNQVTFDEFDRWSEPLKDNILHVLGNNLDTLIGLDRLAFYPWYRTTKLDYAVAVYVQRFEPQPGGDAELSARWTISNATGTLVNRDSHFTRPASSPEETAAALSDMLGDLSREIATALRQTDASAGK